MPLAWPLTTTRVPFRAQTQAGSRRVLGFAGNRRRFFRRDFSLFRESACFRAPASVCQRCLGCVAADARHRFERMNWTARSTRNSPKTAREAPLPSGSCISQSCHRAFKVRCAFHSCRPAAAGEYRLSTHCSQRRLSQRATGLLRNLKFARTAEKVGDGDRGRSNVASTDRQKIPAERLHPKTVYSHCRPIAARGRVRGERPVYPGT